jgi:hypothetical protein
MMGAQKTRDHEEIKVHIEDNSAHNRMSQKISKRVPDFGQFSCGKCLIVILFSPFILACAIIFGAMFCLLMLFGLITEALGHICGKGCKCVCECYSDISRAGYGGVCICLTCTACIGTIVGICIAVFYCPDNIREELNMRNGYVTDHLSRVVVTPRNYFDDILVQ